VSAIADRDERAAESSLRRPGQPLIAVQFTDHKKFNVETDSKVALP
jgi:hypothetical protein